METLKANQNKILSKIKKKILTKKRIIDVQEGDDREETNEKQRGERGKVSLKMNPNQEPYEPKQFQSIEYANDRCVGLMFSSFDLISITQNKTYKYEHDFQSWTCDVLMKFQLEVIGWEL